MFSFLSKKIFGTRSSKILKNLSKILKKINSLEHSIAALTDEQLKNKTQEFKGQLKSQKTLDDILPEAFAVVRETAKRVLGERHYDVQILGGLVLHKGMIAEMKTGEGKTLVSSLPAYLNALTGKGVHIITVNDYLAQRDSEWMGKIYEFHGLTVGCITSSTQESEKKDIYNSDIVYGTNNEFGFDYLRDNLKHEIEHMVQRDYSFAIVDEVDSILIDESRTPLIISGPSSDTSDLYQKTNNIVLQLSEGDYEIDEKSKSALFTDSGNDKVEKLLKDANLIEQESTLYDIDNVSIVHHLNQALKAHKLFKIDVDYIVKGGQVALVDEFTGRIMSGRRYSEGLHQAIEAKERVAIQRENQTLASITFQNYFRMYAKLAGMTGTASTEANEFLDIYGLEVVEIPTNIAVKRQDEDDVVYKTEKAKYHAIIEEVKNIHQTGQPILIGTANIDKSEVISKLLKKAGIKHNVLNAKYHQSEAEIISQAGRLNAVTIATNMAGRGTDIKLGGNEKMLLQKSETDAVKVQKVKDELSKEKEEVLKVGGLCVIGTERHESRRIDNQLRGRSGRQGDPGKTKFYLSLEDDLMRIFGSEKISSFLTKLGLKDDEAIEHPWIKKSLEKAQQKVEARNYEIRKNLLKFDDVMNEQRNVIYQQRKEIMTSEELIEILKEKIEEYGEKILDRYIPKKSYKEEWNLNELQNELFRLHSITADFDKFNDRASISLFLKDSISKKIEDKISSYGKDLFHEGVKRIFLLAVDQFWKDHLHALDRVKTGINLRAYGQKDPLNEYKFEAFSMFENMLSRIDDYAISTIMKMEINHELHSEQEDFSETNEIKNTIDLSNEFAKLSGKERISRNEKCPCGSGKKYKHCHGQIQ